MRMTRLAPGAGAVARLRSSLESLTPALQRVAEFALEQPENVIYLSVTELAERSGSGEASVIRLCRDLGYQGFQDFKLSLTADLAASNVSQPSSELEGTLGIIAHAVHTAERALEETAQILEPDTVDRVVDALEVASRIEVYGVAASGVTAQDFAYKFLRLGLNAMAHTDPHLAAMSAANLTKNTVAIGISRSGSTKDTVHALELAKCAGAFTVAVTHRSRSPITAAHAVLYTSSPESPTEGGAVSSKVGQMLVLEVIFTALLARLKHGRESVRRTAEAVVDKSF
jgi:DNA-binding MurR/RpiR family transcriptional regulator